MLLQEDRIWDGCYAAQVVKLPRSPLSCGILYLTWCEMRSCLFASWPKITRQLLTIHSLTNVSSRCNDGIPSETLMDGCHDEVCWHAASQQSNIFSTYLDRSSCGRRPIHRGEHHSPGWPRSTPWLITPEPYSTNVSTSIQQIINPSLILGATKFVTRSTSQLQQLSLEIVPSLCSSLSLSLSLLIPHLFFHGIATIPSSNLTQE